MITLHQADGFRLRSPFEPLRRPLQRQILDQHICRIAMNRASRSLSRFDSPILFPKRCAPSGNIYGKLRTTNSVGLSWNRISTKVAASAICVDRKSRNSSRTRCGSSTASATLSERGW